MTPRQLITLALKQAGVIGVGQTPLAEDINDAASLASMMLAQWNRKRFLVYHLREVRCALTGAGAYTIGPSETADIQTQGRIVGLQSAYWRYDPGPDGALPGTTGAFGTDFSAAFDSAAGGDPGVTQGGVDFPLTVLRSREDYVSITVKGAGGPPSAVWLDADYPLGRVYVWPVYGTGELRLVVQDQLTGFPDLSSDIQLPEEYREAIFYNLVTRLRSAYGKPADAVVVSLARAALNTLRVANAQIGTLTIDPILSPRGGWADLGGLIGGGFGYGGGGSQGGGGNVPPPSVLPSPLTSDLPVPVNSAGAVNSPAPTGSTPTGSTQTGTGSTGTPVKTIWSLDFSDAANSGLFPGL